LLYNTTIVVLLVGSAVGSRVGGIGLWPTAGLHLVLALGCIRVLVEQALPGRR
jgi:hypothetical protein